MIVLKESKFSGGMLVKAVLICYNDIIVTILSNTVIAGELHERFRLEDIA